MKDKRTLQRVRSGVNHLLTLETTSLTVLKEHCLKAKVFGKIIIKHQETWLIMITFAFISCLISQNSSGL